MSQHEATHECPNCHRPLLGPALSTVGLGGDILLRGCGECLPAAIFDALRNRSQDTLAPNQSNLRDSEAAHEAADTAGTARP